MKLYHFSYWPCLRDRVEASVEIQGETKSRLEVTFAPSPELLAMIEKETCEAATSVVKGAAHAS